MNMRLKDYNLGYLAHVRSSKLVPWFERYWAAKTLLRPIFLIKNSKLLQKNEFCGDFGSQRWWSLQPDIFGTTVLVWMVERALSSLGYTLSIAYSYDETSILEKILRFHFSTSLRPIFLIKNSKLLQKWVLTWFWIPEVVIFVARYLLNHGTSFDGRTCVK